MTPRGVDATLELRPVTRDGIAFAASPIEAARIGSPTGRETPTAKRGDWQALQLIEVTAVVRGFLLSAVARRVFSPAIAQPIDVAFIIYIGIILRLVGLWKSDKMK